MKNPHEAISIYRAYKGDSSESVMITIIRSKNGVVSAFKGYTEKRIAWAGGGGYDKRAMALNEAIEIIYGVELGNGAAGERSVAEYAKAKGITLEGLESDGRYQKCT